MENTKFVKLAPEHTQIITEWLEGDFRSKINEQMKFTKFYVGTPKNSDMFRLLLTFKPVSDQVLHETAIFFEKWMSNAMLKSLNVETTIEVDKTSVVIYFVPSIASLRVNFPECFSPSFAQERTVKQQMVEAKINSLVANEYKKNFEEWDARVQIGTKNELVLLMVEVNLLDTSGLLRLKELFSQIKQEVSNLTIETAASIFMYKNFYVLSVTPLNKMKKAS